MKEISPLLIGGLKQVAEGEPEIVLDALVNVVVADSFIDGNYGSDSKSLSLITVKEEVTVCVKCELCRSRNKVVFGSGNPAARLMFVGEAPGADEDRTGEPFVGRAGQLLTQIIEAMHLRRSDIYIANILKCRPPGNRNPSPFESANCKPYLLKQIEIISPEIIVSLGLVAAINLLELPPTTTVRDLRGRILEFAGKPLIVTYHPAALLRNPALKSSTWEDMKRVMRLLDGSEIWQR